MKDEVIKEDRLPILQYFKYGHLPEKLQNVSAGICSIAEKMNRELSHDDPETLAGLRKLLEAKDCFVRAKLDK